MEPLISVIVPVYNVEKYLDRCVESIVNQTYKNLEIILVDDGSPDNCPKMCDDWTNKDSRIKVIHKENGGVSSARNMGIDLSTGEYIAFVDSDDYLELDMYERMISLIIQENADMASCSIMRENPDESSESWGENNNGYVINDRNKVLIDISSSLDLVCIHTCNKLYSKKVINNVRFNEELIYCEDVLFNYGVALNINNSVYINTPFYHFRYNIYSATHNRKPIAKFDALKVQDSLYELSPKELLSYCVRGDVLKTLDKIKEVLTDNVCSISEYFWLRKRVIKHINEILFSNLYTNITKIKCFILLLFPFFYKHFITIYGKKQVKNNW